MNFNILLIKEFFLIKVYKSTSNVTCNQKLNKVDYNRNGVIEFDEFVDLMMRDYETIDYKGDIFSAFR